MFIIECKISWSNFNLSVRVIACYKSVINKINLRRIYQHKLQPIHTSPVDKINNKNRECPPILRTFTVWVQQLKSTD